MIPEDIAKKIQLLANKKNIKVSHILASCDLDKSVVNSMLNGSMPSIDKIIKIADFFGTSIDELVEREPYAEPDFPHEKKSEPAELIIPVIMKGVPIAANNGAEDWTQDELNKIAEYMEFVKSKRGR